MKRSHAANNKAYKDWILIVMNTNPSPLLCVSLDFSDVDAVCTAASDSGDALHLFNALVPGGVTT